MFDVLMSTKSDLNVKGFSLIVTLVLIWPRKVLSIGRVKIRYIPQKHLSFRSLSFICLQNTYENNSE